VRKIRTNIIVALPVITFYNRPGRYLRPERSPLSSEVSSRDGIEAWAG
jgi:hypothetical protein